MPILDMPLEELKAYQGINPKPDDFDAYWARAIAEMEAVDPQTEITPATIKIPNVRCFDLYFSGTRNGRVYAKLMTPMEIKDKAPALLNFHGYSGNSGDWIGLAAYAQMGFVVAAMDCRGQGGKSTDKNPVEGNTLRGQIIRGLDDPDPDNLYFRQVFLDTALLAKIVAGMDEVDETRIGAYGGSQGGALTVACAALAPDLIKLAAPVHPFLSDYKRVWEMDVSLWGEGAYSDLQDYFRRFDPRHEREDEVFTKLGYIDLHHLADRIKAKTYMFGGLLDKTCPPSTWFAIYNHIKAEKKIAVYPDFRHENLPDSGDLRTEFFSELL